VVHTLVPAEKEWGLGGAQKGEGAVRCSHEGKGDATNKFDPWRLSEGQEKEGLSKLFVEVYMHRQDF